MARIHSFRICQLTRFQASSGPFPFWRDVSAALSEWTNGGRGNWSLPVSFKNGKLSEQNVGNISSSRSTFSNMPLADWSFFGSATDQGILQYFFGAHLNKTDDDTMNGFGRDFATKIFPPYRCPTRIDFCHFTGPHKPWLNLPSNARSNFGKFWGDCTKHWHNIFNSIQLTYPLLWIDRVDQIIGVVRGQPFMPPLRLRSGSLLRTLHVPLITRFDDVMSSTQTNLNTNKRFRAKHSSDNSYEGKGGHLLTKRIKIDKTQQTKIETAHLLPWAFMGIASDGHRTIAMNADILGIKVIDELLVQHVSSISNGLR